MSGCKAMWGHLNDVVDGELAPEDRAWFERHLDSCTACRNELAELKALKKAASALPSEVLPDRDLWPEIDRAIRGSQAASPNRRWQVLAAAASLIAAVAVGWLMMRGPQVVVQTAEVPRTDVEVALASYETASVETVRREYREARAALEQAIEEKRSTLPPETLQVIESNLELIDRAIVEIEHALAANPGAEPLDRQLRLAYRQQIEVLRWATRLAA